MAIKQFTGNIGDLVEFSRGRETFGESTSRTLVGYVWKSEPTKVILSNASVMRDDGLPRNRSFWGDLQVWEETYTVRLGRWDHYDVLKAYVAPP